MSKPYGMVTTSDGDFILDRGEFEKGHLNFYKTVFSKIWPIIKEDDRIKYLMFLPDDNFENKICIQLWLHRGTVFSPGCFFDEEYSNENSVVSSFLAKWLAVPPVENEKEQYKGVFKGKHISFNREYAGYRMTDDECKRLLLGETIILTLQGNGKQYQRAGYLGEGEYAGFKYYGFIWDKSIKLCPLEFAKHKFTESERARLNAGESVLIEDLWSEKKQKYFKRRLVFNKDLGKIEFAETYNYGNGDADSIGV